MRNRLLLVDDHPDILAILREHFEDCYDVATASSGADAIEIVVRNRPDVVFLDIAMPGLTGVEVPQVLQRSGAKRSGHYGYCERCSSVPIAGIRDRPERLC